ncbi:L-threonine aldolase [Rhizorhabdus wittichii RW1]|uniref:L-threonine aldolase n=1 Tax=Rhizorhabdus wittichii (strain DSM 6014 / CCUG 31198 / JCM 15750 / NBRC 105917 / EY 4224 / RW1) TaxID=392499 RepID=A0A9J9H9G2_RHIWR|nr:L-threonine aldolase [Rhizorhabdus wittichii RW1]
MTEDDQAERLNCSHILPGHRPVDVRELLATLAAHPMAARSPDFYGMGGAVAELEAQVAALLGKERGLFFVNGMTAQMTVLRRHADLAGTPNVVIHPLSHMDVDEANGLERAAGLTPVRLGRHAPFALDALEQVSDPLAAVVLELPLRRAGYLLPPIEEVRAIADHCRARGIALHIDGARLWEAAAGYGVELADLAELGDSVYVSLYKGLGGLGGAVIAGSADFIQSLAIWKGRFGGNMFTAFPYALAGLAGLERHLPRMPAYVARARELAALLARDFRLNPVVPHVNAFQLLLPGTREALVARNRAFAQTRGVWLWNTLVEAPIAGQTIAEVVIGESSERFTMEEAAAWISAFSNQ